MSPVDLIVSFAITWTVILVPAILLRWWHKEPFSKRAAFFWALGQFFVNHVLFAVATGRQSNRPFLLFGAFATWYVLQWHTSRSASKSAQEKRRQLGYDE